MKRFTSACFLAAVVAITACIDEQMPVAPETGVSEVGAVDGALAAKKGTPYEMDPAVQAEIEERLTELAHEKAAWVATERAAAGVEMSAGVSVAPLGFSWVGQLDGQTVGSEVFFFDRGNKQIPVQWVPGDPRRGGRTDIGYAFLEFIPELYETPFVTSEETFGAIGRAMETWANQNCSSGLDIPLGTFFEWIFFESDVLHEGFFPLGPGVLGVTIPFIFLDENGPTDIDNDGAFDYAFAIIDYSSDFPWGIDTNTFPFIDVETVALHEMGHGLGQAHFGTAFLTLANGKLHFAPRSVMNAGYSGLQQELTGTDRAGHCSMFGSWPNN